VSLIEANLDDLLPELAPDAAAACFAAGALDVWTTAAQMKRGRPGFVLAALARPADEHAVATAMLRETSTLGVRIAHLDRIELERESRIVQVAGEPVRVKVGRLDGRVVNLAPEHADCERAARMTGAPVKTVWARALAAAHEEHT
jgi:pyridinium-3,5-bisthiocarboxylic acid mononucleotide nickel chelatase